MNKTILGGMITQAGVINSVSDTQDVINFTVLTSQSYRDKEGAIKEQSQFHDCSYFFAKGKADKTAELLTKGRIVELKGKLKTSKPRPGKTRPDANGVQHDKTFVNKGVIVERILKFGQKDASKAAA